MTRALAAAKARAAIPPHSWDASLPRWGHAPRKNRDLPVSWHWAGGQQGPCAARHCGACPLPGHQQWPCPGQPWGSRQLWHPRSCRWDLATAPTAAPRRDWGRGGLRHPRGAINTGAAGRQHSASGTVVRSGARVAAWEAQAASHPRTPPPAPRTGARGTWGSAGARPVARAQPVSRSARARPAAAPTCDRGEVDADEQGEVGGHVAEDVGLVHVHRRVRGAHRGQPPLLHDHALGQVRAPEVLCKEAGGQAARPA